MIVTGRVRMRRPLHMSMRVFVNNAVARMADSVAVDVTVSYECRRLETPLNRFRHMSVSCSMRLGRRDSSGCMSS